MPSLGFAAEETPPTEGDSCKIYYFDLARRNQTTIEKAQAESRARIEAAQKAEDAFFKKIARQDLEGAPIRLIRNPFTTGEEPHYFGGNARELSPYRTLHASSTNGEYTAFESTGKKQGPAHQAIMYKSGHVFIYGPDGEFLRTIPLDEDVRPTFMEFVPGKDILVLGLSNREVWLVSAATGERLASLNHKAILSRLPYGHRPPKFGAGYHPESVSFSPDAQHMLIGWREAVRNDILTILPTEPRTKELSISNIYFINKGFLRVEDKSDATVHSLSLLGPDEFLMSTGDGTQLRHFKYGRQADVTPIPLSKPSSVDTAFTTDRDYYAAASSHRIQRRTGGTEVERPAQIAVMDRKGNRVTEIDYEPALGGMVDATLLDIRIQKSPNALRAAVVNPDGTTTPQFSGFVSIEVRWEQAGSDQATSTRHDLLTWKITGSRAELVKRVNLLDGARPEFLGDHP